MMPESLTTKLTGWLAEDLDRETAESLAGRLAGSGVGPAVLELLAELRENSRKAAASVAEVLPHMLDILPANELVSWIDLIVTLSERSGAIAMKLCRESPALLRDVPASSRAAALTMTLELAEQDAPMAYEGLVRVGGVIASAGSGVLPAWAQTGADLVKWDGVLGIEYFRRGPDILRVLSVDDLKTWAGISAKLVIPNSLGKPDYMAALAFFRTSPALLEDLASPAVRRRVLALSDQLADRSPELAIAFLGEVPGLLRRILDGAWQERVLQYGSLVAEQDAETALAYLRRAPDVIELVNPDPPARGEAGVAPLAGPPSAMTERFEKWYRGGMEVLAFSPEAARAYFASETRKALEALEEAASGVALRSVARMLKLFAEGLSGQPVTIRPLDEGGGEGSGPQARASSDGATIFLPARMRRYPSRDENLRRYKVLTAHEAGHLEYGTYALPMERLTDLAAQASLRYGRSAASPPASLDEFFRLYPNPLLIRDLWVMAEDARVEACLKAEYPGLRRDMEATAREEIAGRSLTHGMSVREMIVELLLQMSAGDPEEVRVPVALEDVVGRAWALLRAVARPLATAEDAVRAVHRAYVLIEELTAGEVLAPSGGTSEETEQAMEPPAGDDRGGSYRPLAMPAHRGAMDAERVREQASGAPADAAEPGVREQDGQEGEPTVGGGSRSEKGPRVLRDAAAVAAPATGRPGSSPLADDVTVVPDESAGRVLPALPGTRAFLYDEWDGRIQDYRTNWCRVVEQAAPEGSDGFLERTRARYGGTVSLIRRYFEGIRPPALRRVRRQADGEEVDIEAAVESLVERRARAGPSEFVYIRRDRKDRDVAAVFLVDLSGSTGQQIGPSGMRIIDIEKEGVVLLCEALEAIGDQYAVYGYSGQSRNDVQILVLKDFDERYGPQVWRRIDALRPLVQNRDGAAIRHALHRLSERAARVKLMVMLSDGRPLDDAYQEEYALEDTRAALREARAGGVHPFCITVDREARGYLDRMYGDVCYLIIDRVESLPERLPRIYRTLTT